MTTTTKRLSEVLISKNIITQAQYEEALKDEQASGKSWGEIVVEKGFATEKQILQNLSEQLGLAYVDLEDYPLDADLIRALPKDIAVKCRALPLIKRANTITVALADPLDVHAIEEIEKILKIRVRPVFASSKQILALISENYTDQKLPFFIKDKSEGSSSSGGREVGSSPESVIKLVDDLIEKAMEMNASDIHLESQAENFYCRYRVDGVLHDMPALPKSHESEIGSRIKIMANMDIAEKRLPQDGRIKTIVKDREADLRISTFPTMYGENIVIRILDKTRSLMNLNELGMPPEVYEKFSKIITSPHGIILVTGPTGSGKSSTIYAALTKINTVEKNIITLEDPIEYEIERISQSQVNVRAGLTFAKGLRSIVRQDPDVIMIGEIRDRETAEIAIHAALTGHLVLSTLHTNDAASSAARLIDIGIEPFLVSSALICVIAQRLVRVLCENCKEAYTPTPEILAQLKLKEDLNVRFFREKGCNRCRGTGFKGRIGIFEILVPDDDLKTLIDKKSKATEIKEATIAKGMKLMREDGIQKLLKGTTSLSEVLRVT